MLLKAKSLGEYELLGETLDDAAGEAFDKTAKLLGLAYPGGPKLAALADLFEAENSAECRVASNQVTKAFPRPMCDRDTLDMSFSGLKTHALLTWQRSDQSSASQKSIAYAFQEAVVDTLLWKCKRALEQTGIKTLVVAGGVGANKRLRAALQTWMTSLEGEVYFPPAHFCTDNGAMVAYAGAVYFEQGKRDEDWAVRVMARRPF